MVWAEPRIQDPEVTPVPAPTPRRTSKSSRTSKAVNETEAAGLEIQGSTQEYPETEVTVSAVLAATEGTPVKKRGRPPKAAKEGMHNNSKRNGGVLSFVCSTNIKKKPEKVTRNVTCLHHIWAYLLAREPFHRDGGTRGARGSTEHWRPQIVWPSAVPV